MQFLACICVHVPSKHVSIFFLNQVRVAASVGFQRRVLSQFEEKGQAEQGTVVRGHVACYEVSGREAREGLKVVMVCSLLKRFARSGLQKFIVFATASCFWGSGIELHGYVLQ